MCSFGAQVLWRLLNPEISLKIVLSCGLDEILFQYNLQCIRGKPKRFGDASSERDCLFWSQVEKFPGVTLGENLFFSGAKPNPEMCSNVSKGWFIVHCSLQC